MRAQARLPPHIKDLTRYELQYVPLQVRKDRCAWRLRLLRGGRVLALLARPFVQLTLHLPHRSLPLPSWDARRAPATPRTTQTYHRTSRLPSRSPLYHAVQNVRTSDSTNGTVQYSTSTVRTRVGIPTILYVPSYCTVRALATVRNLNPVTDRH